MSFIEAPEDQEPIGPDAVSVSQPEVITETPIETEEVPFESLPTFWQNEIKRKREAEASLRARLNDDPFEGFEEQEASAWRDFLKLQSAARRGDPEAIAALEEIMADDEEPEEVEEPLTLERVRQLAQEEAQSIIERRDQIENDRRAVEGVMSKAKELGYETERGKPGFEDYQLLTYYAMLPETQGGPDVLNRAHEMVKAHHQALISKYLSEKEQAANETISTSTGNGVSPGTAKLPFDPNSSEKAKWASVRASLAERLGNQ